MSVIQDRFDFLIFGNRHYSYRIFPFLMVGANLKFRLQNQFGENIAFSHVPGVDLGVYWNPIDHYRLGDLGFSLTFQICFQRR